MSLAGRPIVHGDLHKMNGQRLYTLKAKQINISFLKIYFLYIYIYFFGLNQRADYPLLKILVMTVKNEAMRRLSMRT